MQGASLNVHRLLETCWTKSPRDGIAIEVDAAALEQYRAEKDVALEPNKLHNHFRRKTVMVPSDSGVNAAFGVTIPTLCDAMESTADKTVVDASPPPEQAPATLQDEPSPEPDAVVIFGKTAERPHWITIAVGLVSPTIACVALFLSFESIEMSRKSLDLGVASQKIGQRAYVGAHLTNNVEAFREGGGFWLWRVNLELNNTGNTPASVLLKSVTQGLGEKMSKFHLYAHEHESLFISGKDRATVQVADLTVDGRMLTDSHQMGFPLPSLSVVFRYFDAFGDEHLGQITCSYLFENEKLSEIGCQSSSLEPTKPK